MNWKYILSSGGALVFHVIVLQLDPWIFTFGLQPMLHLLSRSGSGIFIWFPVS